MPTKPRASGGAPSRGLPATSTSMVPSPKSGFVRMAMASPTCVPFSSASSTCTMRTARRPWSGATSNLLCGVRPITSRPLSESSRRRKSDPARATAGATPSTNDLRLSTIPRSSLLPPEGGCGQDCPPHWTETLVHGNGHGGDGVFPLELKLSGLPPGGGKRHLVRLDRRRGLAQLHGDASQVFRLIVGEAPLAGLLVDHQLPLVGRRQHVEGVIAGRDAQITDHQVGAGMEGSCGVSAGAPDLV